VLNPYGVARYEINEIRFEGNTAFTAEELSGVISSRPSELSMTRRITGYVATQLDRNPAAPAELKRILQRIQREVSSELRYLDRTLAANDTLALVAFYHQHGFHHAGAEFDFVRNRQTKLNTLVFRIHEGVRSVVDTVVYYGLNAVAPELAGEMNALKTISCGKPFSLGELNRQNERIIRFLRSNGYYSVQMQKPIVTNIRAVGRADAPDSSSNEAPERDSVTVFCTLGTRVRVAHIAYVDSSAGYTYLSPSVPAAFVDIREGDWYSESAVASSLNKLYRFGLFDVVMIDTTSLFHPQTDSTVCLRVLTKTRAIHELNYGVVAGQDQNSGFAVGGEVRYVNKNLLGGAEGVNPFFQAALLNTNNLFTQGFTATQWEIRTGINLTKPRLFMLADEHRVALEAKTLFSVQQLSLAVPLFLQTFLVQVSLPVEWYSYTLINSLFFDITLDRQSPINFNRTKNILLADAATPERRLFIQQLLFQYGVLDTIVNIEGRQFITNAIVSLQARGDKRDNPFTPRSGYTLDIASEVGIPGIGISGFVRMQATASWFQALERQLVFAARLRGGHTVLLNPESFYVPFDRHFFAGGSNSVRAWGARQLRFRRSGDSLSAASEFIDQIVGNGSILEGSVELRWNFRERPSDAANFFERQISRMGITGFLDFGNAFNSFQRSDEYGQTSLAEALGSIALAVGAGIRYDTPAGPLRLDLAFRLHDPAQTSRWFFASGFMITPTIQIGLGHAF
jgi:outer membrane protein assembly factor BamA